MTDVTPTSPKNAHDRLPRLGGPAMLTDGGMETTLVFHEGLDLPCFAAFPLLEDATGRPHLDRYYRTYAEIARRAGVGIVLETPTWRASPDWARQLGYGRDGLVAVNRAAVELLNAIRADFEPETTVVVSGNLGPRGDGYVVGDVMTAEEAQAYHAVQIGALAAAGAELITVLTMTYAEEAIGIARAARDAGLPVVVSFTVETDGRLPSGRPLGEAVEAVDAATDGYPLYYGINCAHPDHFTPALEHGAGWTARIGMVRANASRQSHAELDACTELDAGDPVELAAQYAALRRTYPQLTVLGGCCGTDDRHVAAIADACLVAGSA